ncbi:TEF13 protein [Gonium pectorale]|uniref:TEF13 protein n=1 Tax=Gonium pectorale TaxID=33097 RepID=A0A150GUA8_GONPE|nr:TEF13 protein [Gonium pectorale]|eukprot:KXZ53445.1 TEF13 protein [Gonium pectorale]
MALLLKSSSLALPTKRLVTLTVRASAEPTPTPAPTNETVEKLQTAANEAWTWVKTKWETTEDTEKPAVIAIVFGVIVAQIATIDVVDRIPIVNKLLQLVGLVVTATFVYKISVDPEERETVKTSVSGFLGKVTGDDNAPELLTLLARLRIPSHPKLEAALALLLRRGQLPSPPPGLWSEMTAADGASQPPSRRRRSPSSTAAAAAAAAAPPPLPTAYRLAIAMASLPVRSHEVWQLLAERHLRGPAPLLDGLGPDALTRLAEAFAAGGYHPVELFGSIAERLLPAAPRLQSGSLARGLHAFARLRHHDPHLAAALCGEVSRRLCGPGSSGGGGSGGGGGSSGGGLLSLFGGGGLVRRGPDRAHRVPQFLLADLARLAEAAVALGASGVRGADGGGGGGDDGLGDALLAAVAEEAEVPIAEAVRRAVQLAAEVAEAEGAAGAGRVASQGSRVAGGGPAATAGPDGGGGLDDDWSPGSNSSGDDGGGGRPVAEHLGPVLSLLAALVSGAAGTESGAAARLAQQLTSQQLVPALPLLERHMQPQHLAAALAALMPAGGAAAAALRGRPHPYPLPPLPQPHSPPASDSAADGADADGAVDVGGQLLAVAAALRRRAEPRILPNAAQLLATWHALAAARLAGAEGAADPRLVSELMPGVFLAVRHHSWLCASPPEAARFVTSCAVLCAFSRAALDLVVAPLVAALYRRRWRRRTGEWGGVAVGRRPGAGGRGAAAAAAAAAAGGGGLEPTALAQLCWALGHLAYDNEDLLAAVQARALALSTPPPASPAALQRSADAGPLAVPAPGGGGSRGAGGGSGGGSPGGPCLGPLELADVMWALAVNEFRSGGGAEFRELYMRAASRGVQSIDDPRWLALSRVHVLLLLGWAGGLRREEAAGLSSSWFNALGYAWERQAANRGEQLAGREGLPPDPDAATKAFRQSLLATARDLLTAGGGGGGGWRLEARYVWTMMRPSSDIRLTLPLLLRQETRPGGGAAEGGSSAGAGAGSLSGGSLSWQWPSSSQWQWLVLDPVRRADEALTWQPSGGGGRHAAAAASAASAAEGDARAAGRVGEEGAEGVAEPLQGSAQERAPAAGAGAGGRDVGSGGLGGGAAPHLHLLGPARWRQLVLRQMGALVRPVRQAEWEQAPQPTRRAALAEALRG